MSLLATRFVLAAAIESTYGQDATPSGSDAILCENLAPTRPAEMIDRNQLGDPSLSPFKPILGRAMAQAQFDVEMRASGTRDIAPEWGPLLRCCGFQQIETPSISVEWRPRSDGIESTTVYAWRDGIRYAMLGCRGNVVFRFPAGQRAMMSFTLQGHLPANIAVDEAMPTPSLDPTVPEPMRGITLDVGGYQGAIGSLEFDLQNQIVMPDNSNASDGYGEVRITGRDGQGSFNPEATLVATQDWFDFWTSGQQALTQWDFGQAVGTRLAFDLQMVARAVDDADDNGILRYQIPFSAPRSGTDDEFSIIQN